MTCQMFSDRGGWPYDDLGLCVRVWAPGKGPGLQATRFWQVFAETFGSPVIFQGTSCCPSLTCPSATPGTSAKARHLSVCLSYSLGKMGVLCDCTCLRETHQSQSHPSTEPNSLRVYAVPGTQGRGMNERKLLP